MRSSSRICLYSRLQNAQYQAYQIRNEEESWRQQLVENDNISYSQSHIPNTGETFSPEESTNPSSPAVSSNPKKRGRPTKSDTKS